MKVHAIKFVEGENVFGSEHFQDIEDLGIFVGCMMCDLPLEQPILVEVEDGKSTGTLYVKMPEMIAPGLLVTIIKEKPDESELEHDAVGGEWLRLWWD